MIRIFIIISTLSQVILTSYMEYNIFFSLLQLNGIINWQTLENYLQEMLCDFMYCLNIFTNSETKNICQNFFQYLCYLRFLLGAQSNDSGSVTSTLSKLSWHFFLKNRNYVCHCDNLPSLMWLVLRFLHVQWSSHPGSSLLVDFQKSYSIALSFSSCFQSRKTEDLFFFLCALESHMILKDSLQHRVAEGYPSQFWIFHKSVVTSISSWHRVQQGWRKAIAIT